MGDGSIEGENGVECGCPDGTSLRPGMNLSWGSAGGARERGFAVRFQAARANGPRAGQSNHATSHASISSVSAVWDPAIDSHRKILSS